MSKKDLQTELRNRGLPKSGNKAALKQRLQEPQRPEQYTELEVIQLEIVGSHNECNSTVPALTEDLNDFKRNVFDELCILREQVQ